MDVHASWSAGQLEMQKVFGHGRVRPAVAVRSDAASHAASWLTKTPSCGPVNPSAADLLVHAQPAIPTTCVLNAPSNLLSVKVASEGNGGLDLRVSAGASIDGGDSSSAASICEWERAQKSVNMAAQAQQVQQKVEYFVAQIDKELSRYPALKKFEQTVPIPKAYAALGAFGIFTLPGRSRRAPIGWEQRSASTRVPLRIAHFSQCCCPTARRKFRPGKDNSLIIFAPAAALHSSLPRQFVFFNIAAGFLTNLLGFFVPAYFSLKALESPQPEDDVQWLTYWVVFGMFTFLETFSSIVLYYVPWYYTIKTLAIVWLMLPQTQGAKMVYSKVIRPAFLTTQKTVHKANASTPAAPAETH
ncbi:hypothetical protein PaG_03941 [Moesziomyces aphidis]|uniref:Protein YOP1 n=1 Tax=Moesziomyces aphidis TaxID=84754 RepID=W3VM22_MOEAP|nr:hypothetical protein PaG_03941 [Moesziomyces aphidis]